MVTRSRRFAPSFAHTRTSSSSMLECQYDVRLEMTMQSGTHFCCSSRRVKNRVNSSKVRPKCQSCESFSAPVHVCLTLCFGTDPASSGSMKSNKLTSTRLDLSFSQVLSLRSSDGWFHLSQL